MKTLNNQEIKLIEHIKTITCPNGEKRLVVKAEFAQGLWCERDTLRKLIKLRQRELSEIKRGLARIRGLLGDVD